MERVGCVVVGAGVIGLAVARRLALAGHEPVLIEREHAIGQGVSSRNSEVIHAGLYYPTGSAKAMLCVAGNSALYGYCRSRGVASSRLGKLVVATTPDQAGTLTDLLEQGRSNGVDDLRLLDGDEARALEPALRCEAALLSPSTGIVDSHGLMRALHHDVESSGGTTVFDSPVVSGHCNADGVVLRVGDSVGTEVQARVVVNAAGLAATSVARAIEGPHLDAVPSSAYAKGSYFSLSQPAPFSRLVYPVPEPGGLGVHLTLDMGGRARFGPDVEWLDGEEWQLDYTVDPERGEAFYAQVRRYWPGLPDGALVPDFAGVRPKVAGPSGVLTDFRIDMPGPGEPGLVNLFGIESPGLTSALAIAEEVAAVIGAP